MAFAARSGVFSNPSEFLGACFMDHFGFSPGYLAASEGLMHYRHQQREGAPVLPAITARDPVRSRLRFVWS